MPNPRKAMDVQATQPVYQELLKPGNKNATLVGMVTIGVTRDKSQAEMKAATVTMQLLLKMEEASCTGMETR